MIKWLPDVSPDDQTVDVAARALAGRLDAVRRYLKRAARTADAEAVHQLRVWTRRAVAAVDLYDELIPTKYRKWFRKWLRRLRRAAGRVRDSDVFAGQLAGDDPGWAVRLRSERRRGLKKIRGLAGRLEGGRRLKRRTRKLLDRLGGGHAGTRGPFGDWARAHLRPMVDAFFAAAPGEAADDAALHRFRIRGKQLRYAMELLAGAFPPAFREQLYPPVGTLQDRLGLVNDQVTARRRLDEWLAGTADPAAVSHLRRRLAVVGDELAQARSDFYRWWTPELREWLRARLDEYLGPAPAPP